ncbi:hypothetical protein ACH4RG_14285 [Streptomyces sp. NPDC021019]|uniref:hypothetical protein n=1 Tax=Streptomyces sp. NPDC021019 TaxID=3365108 RepID=UPI003789475D
MQKTTHPAPASAEVPVGWCDWHEGPSGTAVLVSVIEQCSGPGITRYACAPCREQRRLVPYSQQP